MKSERISPFWVNGYQPFSAQGVEPFILYSENQSNILYKTL